MEFIIIIIKRSLRQKTRIKSNADWWTIQRNDMILIFILIGAVFLWLNVWIREQFLHNGVILRSKKKKKWNINNATLTSSGRTTNDHSDYHCKLMTLMLVNDINTWNKPDCFSFLFANYVCFIRLHGCSTKQNKTKKTQSKKTCTFWVKWQCISCKFRC